ncbi:DUF3545 family protein [Vibrio makurazakiensis]|uniref:DUF3545 family protein n=1 Tax=Vibrio makurazakiensis TaxID=2910250 RepID=UPI003D0B189E
MEGFQFDDIAEIDAPRTQKTRSKPVKRKWREIEAINDRRRLQKELKEMGIGVDFSIEDIEL